MTEKQFEKALNTQPKNVRKVVAAWDKLNKWLDRNPEVAPIIHRYSEALGFVEDIATGELSPKGEKFMSEARQIMVNAYNVGSV